MIERTKFDSIYLRYPEGWGFSQRNSQLYRYSIYNEMIERLQPAPQHILDLGCGEGFFSRLLKDRFQANVTGIELSHVAIERAKAKYPDIDFIEGSVTSIPWDSFAYGSMPDFVLLGEVLYYLNEQEQDACVRDIRAAIPKGTHVLVSVNIGPSPYFTRERLHQLFTGFRCIQDRGIYLRTFSKLFEGPLWILSSRLPRPVGKIVAAPLRHIPIPAIDSVSKRMSPAEESIYVAMFRAE